MAPPQHRTPSWSASRFVRPPQLRSLLATNERPCLPQPGTQPSGPCNTFASYLKIKTQWAHTTGLMMSLKTIISVLYRTNCYEISQQTLLLDIIHRPLFIKKHRPVYFSKHNVSETEFCLRLQIKPTQLGPIDRASPYI
jgi:hypothetical protein